MTDIYSPAKRSEVMAKVRGRDTEIERLLRSALHRLGLRFRLNVAALPGRPDIVLPRYRTVVFVHGCYWHHHQGCRRASLPKSNRDFWKAKLSSNVRRDRVVAKALHSAGWHTLIAWECDIMRDVAESARRIRDRLCESLPQV